jgi:hypothetical protein
VLSAATQPPRAILVMPDGPSAVIAKLIAVVTGKWRHVLVDPNKPVVIMGEPMQKSRSDSALQW